MLLKNVDISPKIIPIVSTNSTAITTFSNIFDS
jgi:hypothetical protein